MDHTVDPDAQLKGYKYKEVDYTFSNGNFSSSIDVNGQLVHGISYYPNNQPRSISVQGGGESYSYTLSGMKFKQERQELVDGQIETEERYYIGGVEFVDGVMQTFYFPDGRIVLDKGSKEIFAQYKIKDHLGNTAVVFQDKDLDDVVIDEEAADAFNLELEVLQRDFYYPFGLSMEGAWIAGSTDDPRMDYRYNGKELSQVTGLMDYGFRYYDPTIGRWSSVDPLAEIPNQVYVSPFGYVANNPISLIDPDGRQFAQSKDPDDYYVFDEMGRYLRTEENDQPDQLVIENSETKERIFYEFNDPEHDVKLLNNTLSSMELSDLDKYKILLNISSKDLGVMMKDSDANYIKNPVLRRFHVGSNSVGGKLDFSVYHLSRFASLNGAAYLTPADVGLKGGGESKTLFFTFENERLNTTYNFMDAGNWMWGNAVHRVGGTLNNAVSWAKTFNSQDSQADLNAIISGWHSFK